MTKFKFEQFFATDAGVDLIEGVFQFSQICTECYNTKFGSPIEEMLAMAFLIRHECSSSRLEIIHEFGLTDKECFEKLGEGPQVRERDLGLIYPQVSIGRYRVDFFVVWNGYGKQQHGLIVECDGHEFHERTKEQAARDKQRDRDLLWSAYPTVRFTGSEIYNDPLGAAREFEEVVSSSHEREMRGAHPEFFETSKRMAGDR